MKNNVVGSYHLIESARTAGIKHFVFSQNLLLKYGQAAWTDKMPQQYQVLHILRGKAKNQKAFQWHDQSCVPKLRSARSPCSLGSRSTTSRLILQLM